jgi:hypothetical protein
MKCDECGKGNLERKIVTQKVEIEGAPTFEVPVEILQCSNCDEYEIDTIASKEKDKKVLEELVRYYGPRKNELPGKVAYWMRSVIELPQNALAKESGVDASTLSVAANRNSKLDTFAAVVLLAHCIDFLSGNDRGTELTNQIQNLAALLDVQKIPTLKGIFEGSIQRRELHVPLSRGDLTKMVEEQSADVEQNAIPYYMLTAKNRPRRSSKNRY